MIRSPLHFCSLTIYHIIGQLAINSYNNLITCEGVEDLPTTSSVEQIAASMRRSRLNSCWRSSRYLMTGNNALVQKRFVLSWRTAVSSKRGTHFSHHAGNGLQQCTGRCEEAVQVKTTIRNVKPAEAGVFSRSSEADVGQRYYILQSQKLLGLSLHHLGFVLTQNCRVAGIPKHEHKPGHLHL